MARADLESLYRHLMDTRFAFVQRGVVPLRTIYEVVKLRYPELCDDTYSCSTNCKSGIDQPEWKHLVRTALNETKKRGTTVAGGESRGTWVFAEAPAPTPVLTEPVIEGRLLLKQHKLRERKPQVVRAKKRAVLATHGRLACEVCDFDFAIVYGSLGDSFAECHHRIPVASLDGNTTTRLEDLAIVCANCHRMLHRGLPMPSVEDLRRLVFSLKTLGS